MGTFERYLLVSHNCSLLKFSKMTKVQKLDLCEKFTDFLDKIQPNDLYSSDLGFFEYIQEKMNCSKEDYLAMNNVTSKMTKVQEKYYKRYYDYRGLEYESGKGKGK